jgi:hypothetical protein
MAPADALSRPEIQIFYATFTTRTAGMPFMATIIAPVTG